MKFCHVPEEDGSVIAAECDRCGGQTMNDGRPGKQEKKPILSSTAGDSLQRAMGNYLKGGDKRSAKMLYDRYSYRMTPGQKKRAARLFGKYGVEI